MKNFNYLISLSVLIALGSCSKKDLLEQIPEEKTIARNATELTPFELELESGRKAYQDLTQLEGIDFYIRSLGSNQGRNALQTQGKRELVSIVAPTAVIPTNQLFFLRPVPGSDELYLEILSRRENAMIGLGLGFGVPSDGRLRTYSAESFPGSQGQNGYAWRFVANQTGNAYFMINMNYFIQRPGTDEFFWLAIRNSDGIITTGEMNANDPFQQFQFIPNDQFIVERVDMNIEGANILSSNPIVLSERIVDNFSPEPASRTLTFSETLQENFSFNQSSSVSYQFVAGASASVTIASVLTIGGNFTVTRGSSQILQYGRNVTKTISLSESYTVPVPGQTRSVLTFSAIRHNVRVPYTATLRGRDTNKIININGFFEDVNYSATILTINNFSLANNTLISQSFVYPNPKN